ncbi:hypothetical protein MTR67_034512 [Solanum verrucosum]|uniref:Uncharacterized protein n=1 Tax=Solanum verrucosum TaxID=315347 RepID=A0AAF0U8B6_SOLVR|nr:hypothetical protein MTR67_034512 [Solanum verrucosum]
MLMKMNYSMGMEAKHQEDMASKPPLYGVGSYDTGFHGLLSWSMSVNSYSHHVRRTNGKFTFGGLDVVLSVDCGMGRYSYIAHSIAWDCLR